MSVMATKGAKVTLAIAGIACVGMVWWVTVNQRAERNRMREGVYRDLEREKWRREVVAREQSAASSTTK